MGRLRAASLLLVALAAGLLLAGCGGGSKGELLPGTTAEQITSNLDLVRETFNEGNCEEAEEAVAQVSTEIDELQKVDAKLKSALRQGAVKLSEVVSTCDHGEEEAEGEQAAEEAEEREQLELQEAEAEEEQAFEKEHKAEEREEKAQEKAEKEAEQPGPPEEGEESGTNGKGKSREGQEEIEPPSSEEEVTSPGTSGGPAGGIGPGAAVGKEG